MNSYFDTIWDLMNRYSCWPSHHSQERIERNIYRQQEKFYTDSQVGNHFQLHKIYRSHILKDQNSVLELTEAERIKTTWQFVSKGLRFSNFNSKIDSVVDKLNFGSLEEWIEDYLFFALTDIEPIKKMTYFLLK